MGAIVHVKNLSRDFGEIRAVDDLSFSVEEGQTYGFLGQNGAGKSTTIRMMLSLVRPSSGEIEIFGLNLRHHRKEILRQVGAIIERPDLYKYLSALENLRIFAALSGVKLPEKKLVDQLAKVGLADRARSKVKTYSQGMRQRLGIAVALVHDPSLIILDEPTNGLDPHGIADVRNLIVHLTREAGKTIFISSHLLNEMEMIADSMLIIDKGRKVAEGRKEALLDPADTVVEVVTDDDRRSADIIRKTKWAPFLIEDRSGNILLKIKKESVPELNRTLVEKGLNVVSLRSKHSLEDLFLSLTAQA